MPSPQKTRPSQTRQPAEALQALRPGLYVVSTPIGNLRDITLRALDVLAGADLVLAEDTRSSRVLFQAHGLQPSVTAYHEHNAASVRPQIVARIVEGAAVALISDAGTPLISDPGFKLVRDVVAAGGAVTPVPGPSAPLAGLVASGLPSDRFLFAGFPPAKAAARRTMLAELAHVPATLIFFEAGGRLRESLSDMADVLGDRPAAVARELTKLYEDVTRDTLSALAARYAHAGPPRGELVVAVGPPENAAWDDKRVDAALTQALAGASVKDAAAEVAVASGRPRREVYARALTLKAAGPNVQDADGDGGKRDGEPNA